ncbi:hypothetical protein [Niallia nealsonii]|uniref:Uncharacterized protein n=1 Tax=Niallia nealsonii TaxID=115979 RepID=A0A2N0Z6V6_9BACI|nr:hypothetical protein [Niallia nealsonii]PKG25256.1 hypothetical protein CWS01_02570 [Niallia nealsonii]
MNQITKSATKIKINGFKMHQAILDEFRMVRDESFERPPASAYVVYLTMLKQLDLEKNQRGMLKDYNLSYWAKKLSIPYSSLYSGRLYLEKYHFIKEEIHNDYPVLLLKDVEKYNNPGSEGQINYLLIPHALFETNILAELVRTSNPGGIELMLSLFNQFRTALSKKETIELDKLRQTRNMSTLKKQLKKNAKKVRELLSLLEPLFSVEYEGVSFRGNQMWISKVWITLKNECVKEESPEDFNVAHLTAMLSHELTYFLDGLRLKYKPRDQFDVMISFQQEIYKKVMLIPEQNGFKRDKAIKNAFIHCLDSIGEYIHKQKQIKTTFHIHSIGAFFRRFFKKQFVSFIKSLDYTLIHEYKVAEYAKNRTIIEYV